MKAEPRIIPKSKSPLMWLFSLVLGKSFMTDFWTTYRLPFCRAKITYPDSVKNPEEYHWVIDHEMFHVKQLAPWYGPIWMLLLATLFPLPMFYSGRWFIERHAYLHDIKRGQIGIVAAVDTLWNGYGRCWPRESMRKWFQARMP